MIKVGMTPSHPGEFVRDEIIKPLGITVTKAAAIMRVSRPGLSAFLHGKARLSADMALRIDKAFGYPFDTLLRIQNLCDIAEARRRVNKIRGVKRYRAAA